ncbi:hypothetical protein TNCV_1421161 [Trichonephila clavipes]|nr:hypothetical protein TNCV_1421161 [Trichonephila clavipes]
MISKAFPESGQRCAQDVAENVFKTCEKAVEYLFLEELESEIIVFPPEVDELTDEEGFDDTETLSLSVRDVAGVELKLLFLMKTMIIVERKIYQTKVRSEVARKQDQMHVKKFGLAIHQNDHQARRRFVEWAQNEIAVVPDFHKRILFSDKAHFWLNGYVNKQNCRIWREANPQVYVETPLHPEKLTVWCALWAGGILLQKR